MPKIESGNLYHPQGALERSFQCVWIAEKGQVIYLTHHGHMRDIARQVCGKGVHVHELPTLTVRQIP